MTAEEYSIERPVSFLSEMDPYAFHFGARMLYGQSLGDTGIFLGGGYCPEPRPFEEVYMVMSNETTN